MGSASRSGAREDAAAAVTAPLGCSSRGEPGIARSVIATGRAAPLHGFPPILGARPRVLILGSFPSPASLERAEYYAHPRNAFWPIMARVLGFPADAAYPDRARALTQAGIALWDVLAACARAGSSDGAILRASEVENDLAGLLRDQPTIRWVLLNGGKAWMHWRRLRSAETIPARRLPATSPALTLPFDAKLQAWRAALVEAGVVPATAGGFPDEPEA